MSESKHTPGPWNLADAPRPGTTWTICGTTGRQKVATVDPGGTLNGSHVPMDEHKANARLITAAPDMLAELQRLATLGVGDGWSGCVSCRYVQEAGHHKDCKLAAVIAKAKGGAA